MRRTLGAAMLSGGLAVAVLAAVAPTASANPTDPERTSLGGTGAGITTFGTLNTEPQTASNEKAAGMADAMMEIDWSRFEPQPGVFDAAYIASLQQWLASLKSAGMSVTLGLGMHYTPSWIFDLPDSRYVDEHGNVSSDANFIYNSSVRAAARTYLDEVSSQLGLQNFSEIRITSGGDSELLYPGGGSYWAFDAGALGGSDLPAGMTPNPDPTWTPGTPGLSAEQMQNWLDWYVSGLDNVANWQTQVLDGLGYTGGYDFVTPGSGVRPDVVTTDIQNDLPDGVAGVGAVWQQVYAGLDDASRDTVYVSSLADGSGDNDGCQPGDDSVALDSPEADSWSAARWLARIASADGMSVAGENPGYDPDSPSASFYRDTTSQGMMAVAIRQATSCHFTQMFWAHDIHLYDGTVPFSAWRNKTTVATLAMEAGSGSVNSHARLSSTVGRTSPERAGEHREARRGPGRRAARRHERRMRRRHHRRSERARREHRAERRHEKRAQTRRRDHRSHN